MIDLHMHSRASDGTDSIAELLENIRRAGINIFSVTDHDTIDGTLEMESIVPKNMRFIRGIEFSCKTAAGKCHILGYGFDSENEDFKQMLEEGRMRRRNKLERRLEFLKSEFGIEFTDNEVSKLRSMNSVGKPHLGNFLVEHGFSADKNSAIEKYINPCKTESDRLDGEKVVRAILSAGGIPVLAHPFGGTNEKEVPLEKFERQVEILRGSGLMGLECYYSKYDESQIGLLLKAAEKNGLCVSAGSDYHGKNKKVSLGEVSKSGVEVSPEMLTILSLV
ncbi:MAG: PHP domain-containing protein [Lachnospiraceae bacterium]|nr:PHP domain-containing protein [Lachnospiraceae bacterium]